MFESRKQIGEGERAAPDDRCGAVGDPRPARRLSIGTPILFIPTPTPTTPASAKLVPVAGHFDNNHTASPGSPVP